MDPLAELVKIDPKSIGVGQYQHDVDQTALKSSLDDVVMSCVNGVGVELNTASKQLLSYVSGLGPALAANIVAYRNENGPFKSRAQLLKVPRLGPKAFEQAAGFLRIRDGDTPLDASAVHPESYGIVDTMAKDFGCSVQDLLRDAGLRQKIQLKSYVTETVGLPTLHRYSGRARQARPRPAREIRSLCLRGRRGKDGRPQAGHEAAGHRHQRDRLRRVCGHRRAPGRPGPHQPVGRRFVKDPADVVKVHQKVMVTVTEVDLPRKRIALSMKANPEIGGKSGGDRTSPSSGGPRPPKPSGPKPVDWFSEALQKGSQRKH